MNKINYPINKGINRSVVFRGLKAQYIWYMGAGMFGLLIVYAIMYVLGVNTYLSLLLTCFLAGGYIALIYHLSEKYGEHGLTKALARRSIPKLVRVTSRAKFINPKI